MNKMSKDTLAEKIISYHQQLSCDVALPEEFAILDPFRENPETRQVMQQFYRKFYNDSYPRKFIIGINPGRFGAGITGIPFTDTKHLKSHCDIDFSGKDSHEPSAVFVYKMIEAYGGAAAFYRDIYIHSVFPLALIRQKAENRWVNCNYYDDKRLQTLLKPFMVTHLQEQLQWGLNRDVAFVLGKKNAGFVAALNDEYGFFDRLEVLEHPRYIQQYKSKEAGAYAQKFVDLLKGI